MPAQHPRTATAKVTRPRATKIPAARLASRCDPSQLRQRRRRIWLHRGNSPLWTGIGARDRPTVLNAIHEGANDVGKQSRPGEQQKMIAVECREIALGNEATMLPRRLDRNLRIEYAMHDQRRNRDSGEELPKRPLIRVEKVPCVRDTEQYPVETAHVRRRSAEQPQRSELHSVNAHINDPEAQKNSTTSRSHAHRVYWDTDGE
jgi:hypothetical protein